MRRRSYLVKETVRMRRAGCVLQLDIQGGSSFCWPVHGSELHSDRWTVGCEAHTKFSDEISMPDGQKCLEVKEVINFWAAWGNYVSRRAVRFMRGSLFMICQQWTAVINSIIRLFLVTINMQCVPSCCGILKETCISVTPMWNTDMLENVGENFDVNFVMKGFPADK
jgi:hypothetical protein